MPTATDGQQGTTKPDAKAAADRSSPPSPTADPGNRVDTQQYQQGQQHNPKHQREPNNTTDNNDNGAATHPTPAAHASPTSRRPPAPFIPHREHSGYGSGAFDAPPKAVSSPTQRRPRHHHQHHPQAADVLADSTTLPLRGLSAVQRFPEAVAQLPRRGSFRPSTNVLGDDGKLSPRGAQHHRQQQHHQHERRANVSGEEGLSRAESAVHESQRRQKAESGAEQHELRRQKSSEVHPNGDDEPFSFSPKRLPRAASTSSLPEQRRTGCEIIHTLPRRQQRDSLVGSLRHRTPLDDDDDDGRGADDHVFSPPLQSSSMDSSHSNSSTEESFGDHHPTDLMFASLGAAARHHSAIGRQVSTASFSAFNSTAQLGTGPSPRASPSRHRRRSTKHEHARDPKHGEGRSGGGRPGHPAVAIPPLQPVPIPTLSPAERGAALAEGDQIDLEYTRYLSLDRYRQPAADYSENPSLTRLLVPNGSQTFSTGARQGSDVWSLFRATPRTGRSPFETLAEDSAATLGAEPRRGVAAWAQAAKRVLTSVYHSPHTFTVQELTKMAAYESVDYWTPMTDIFVEHLQKQEEGTAGAGITSKRATAPIHISAAIVDDASSTQPPIIRSDNGVRSDKEKRESLSPERSTGVRGATAVRVMTTNASFEVIESGGAHRRLDSKEEELPPPAIVTQAPTEKALSEAGDEPGNHRDVAANRHPLRAATGGQRVQPAGLPETSPAEATCGSAGPTAGDVSSQELLTREVSTVPPTASSGLLSSASPTGDGHGKETTATMTRGPNSGGITSATVTLTPTTSAPTATPFRNARHALSSASWSAFTARDKDKRGHSRRTDNNNGTATATASTHDLDDPADLDVSRAAQLAQAGLLEGYVGSTGDRGIDADSNRHVDGDHDDDDGNVSRSCIVSKRRFAAGVGSPRRTMPSPQRGIVSGDIGTRESLGGGLGGARGGGLLTSVRSAFSFSSRSLRSPLRPNRSQNISSGFGGGEGGLLPRATSSYGGTGQHVPTHDSKMTGNPLDDDDDGVGGTFGGPSESDRLLRDAASFAAPGSSSLRDQGSPSDNDGLAHQSRTNELRDQDAEENNQTTNAVALNPFDKASSIWQTRNGRHYMKAALHVIIGLVVGAWAVLLFHSIDELQGQKFMVVERVMFDHGPWPAFALHLALSLAAISISTGVCVLYQAASGSGVPEVMAYLNGVVTTGAFRIGVLIFKSISCAGAVTSGIPVGAEGPMIHIGALIGGGIASGHSRTLRLGKQKFMRNLFAPVQNPKDRRDFITAGAAAGVTSVFGAPLGGLTFVMEEVATVMPPRLVWMAFAGCFCCFAVIQFLNGYLDGWQLRNRQGTPVLGVPLFASSLFNDNYAAAQRVAMNWLELLPAIGIGAVMALVAGLFIKLHLFVASKWRARHIAAPVRQRWAKPLEPILVTVLFAVIWFWLPFAFPCAPIPPEARMHSPPRDAPQPSGPAGTSSSTSSSVQGAFNSMPSSGGAPVAGASLNKGHSQSEASSASSSSSLSPRSFLSSASSSSEGSSSRPWSTPYFRPDLHNLQFATAMCPENAAASSLNDATHYNPLQTLSLSGAYNTIRMLFSRHARDLPPAGPVAVYFGIYSVGAAYCVGMNIASGVVIPTLVIGAAGGRLLCAWGGTDTSSYAVSAQAILRTQRAETASVAATTTNGTDNNDAAEQENVAFKNRRRLRSEENGENNATEEYVANLKNTIKTEAPHNSDALTSLHWIDPGVAALVGAAAFFGGLSRLTFSVVVIMVEISNDLSHVAVVMIAIAVAKVLADRMTHSLYHEQLAVRGVPFLDYDTQIHKLDCFTAQDIMSQDPVVIPCDATVSEIREVLESTKHNGFPVVKSVSDKVLLGVITREELQRVLWFIYDHEQAAISEALAKARKARGPDSSYQQNGSMGRNRYDSGSYSPPRDHQTPRGSPRGLGSPTVSMSFSSPHAFVSYKSPAPSATASRRFDDGSQRDLPGGDAAPSPPEHDHQTSHNGRRSGAGRQDRCVFKVREPALPTWSDLLALKERLFWSRAPPLPPRYVEVPGSFAGISITVDGSGNAPSPIANGDNQSPATNEGRNGNARAGNDGSENDNGMSTTALLSHDTAGNDSITAARFSFEERQLDLTPFVDCSTVFVVQNAAVSRAYALFRTCTLRHLVVVSRKNKVVGMITRRDLLGHSLRESCLRAAVADAADPLAVGADAATRSVSFNDIPASGSDEGDVTSSMSTTLPSDDDDSAVAK